MSAHFASLHIDNLAPEPLWRQLYIQLDDLLTSGTLQAGTSLPPERELAETLGVSRSTVKRSYDQLRHDQRIGGRGRAGSVVRRPERVEPTLGRLKGFTEEMRELGMEPSTRLLALEIVHDRTIASIFGRPSHAPLLHVRRLRLGNGAPMSRELAWYDLTLAPQLEDWSGNGSAYAWLREHCGIEMDGADQSIEAVLSSAQEMEAFGFDTPMPCLLIKRRSLDTEGRMIEYVEGTFRGDAYAYRVHLPS